MREATERFEANRPVSINEARSKKKGEVETPKPLVVVVDVFTVPALNSEVTIEFNPTKECYCQTRQSTSQACPLIQNPVSIYCPRAALKVLTESS